MMSEAEGFDTDLRLAFEGSPHNLEFRTIFFRHVYQPMWETFLAYKAKDYEKAMVQVAFVAATDWRYITEMWLSRFLDKDLT